jgi:phage terminase large subunit
MYGISSPFADRQEVKQFKLFGNKINLLGAENESVFSGNSCDYAYFNEMLDISKNVFDDTEQRCRKFWWGDYNPKYTDHWVYDKVALRKNVSFLKTTFLDNPYLSVNERNKILSYEPTHPDDRELPKEERRPHPTNIDEGTADDYRWNVFGLGLRSAPEGLIFQHVKWIKQFPTKINRVYYGSDIGFTNSPSTIVKVGVDGKDLYLECLYNNPTPRPEDYIAAIEMCVGRKDYCVADSADGKKKASDTTQGALGYISECRRAGLKVYAANKFKGSIIHGISMMLGYRIHIVENPHFRKEQGAYRWREINGIRLDEPLDMFNHLWDASRYAVLFNLMKK